MTKHSVQPRDVKGYGFLSFAKNNGKSISENISKCLSGKYSQKLLDHAKQSATDAIKIASKRVNRKIADATGDSIRNKIANKIMQVSKKLLQNNSDIVTNEHKKEIPKERYISPEERQKTIDELWPI